MDIARGRFSLRSFHPYEMSVEDLRPIIAARETEGDSATILGLEMDQESVREVLLCSSIATLCYCRVVSKLYSKLATYRNI